MTDQNTKIQHTPGKWWYQKAEYASSSLTCWSVGKDNVDLAKLWANTQQGFKLTPKVQRANAILMSLAPTAPHSCDVPDCPGNKVRKQLAAGENLAEATKALIAPGAWSHDTECPTHKEGPLKCDATCGYLDRLLAAREALAAWSEANKTQTEVQ